MKETLICKLEKHYIYYLNDVNCGFYIIVPYKDYTDTNITIRLKSNYQNYDLNNNSLEYVTNELINYYKDIDNYNVTLILPVFYNDILLRIRTVTDMDIYQNIDKCIGSMFNAAYTLLTRNNIKVNNKIYVINNDSFKKFTNWFVARYSSRIEYKTVLELIKQEDGFKGYDVVETPSANFVVGSVEAPSINKTTEIEVETFDNYARNIPKKEETPVPEGNAGFVSYLFLGVITFVVSMAMLYFFIK